ncbi:predicted protein [Plenodomus lingam JN3]|uniref:Predicted protein n=1 Tax=Leptosphaeria maculans (strain JN3 / isolate v23.1.3 / race Av1-4-5-6-7-8) TaxID=985895 RepID=E5A224_LEPMJ|nr:predicted protein [Plenodomus lingam JN3]CBX97741.1 predicted protein [Plenodomus lingam JN3]
MRQQASAAITTLTIGAPRAERQATRKGRRATGERPAGQPLL